MIASAFQSLLLQVDPVGHVVNQPFYITEGGWWLWSAHMGNLVLAGVIMLVLFPWMARKIDTGPDAEGNDRYVTRSRVAHAFEVVCVYLRDNTVRPLLGDRTDRFMPFLWTLFFFVLTNNLLGLLPLTDLWHALGMHSIPVGGTATQNLWVTGALALVSGLVINIAGLRELGVGGYMHHLTAGTPAYLWPLMVPIEILGTFIKPIALAIRLFANMTAGHILLATLFIFAAMGIGMIADATRPATGAPITLVSALGAVGIYFLELFVAFLQAFIFFFLTTVFISQLSHHHHDHSEEHAPEPAADEHHNHRAPHPHGDAPGPASPVPA